MTKRLAAPLAGGLTCSDPATVRGRRPVLGGRNGPRTDYLPKILRVTALTISSVAVLTLSAVQVTAASFGGGPSDNWVEFFPNDSAVWERVLVLSSNEPDNKIMGYTCEFLDPPDQYATPPDLYASFVRGSEQRSVQVLDETSTGNLRRWPQPFLVGRTGPGVALPAAPDDYHEARVYARSIFPSAGSGSTLVPGVYIKLYMRYRTPEIPLTEWSFTNTSAHDIRDSHLVISQMQGDPGLRYIVLPDIPVGEAIAIQGQMDPNWTWAFGGILDDGNDSPVISFDEVAGVSPAGEAFTDVFRNVGTVYSGLGAAILGHTGEVSGGGEGYEDIGGSGYPAPGYATDFPAMSSFGETQSCALYAFRDTAAELVGSGGAAAVPEPATLTLLVVAGLLLLCRKRKRSE